MKLVKNLSIGQTIEGTKFGKSVVGKIVKKLPGAVVVECANGNREVVDMDRINKVI